MKRCPQCTKTYDDEMDFCFDDGTPLRDLEADIPTVAFTAPISMPTAPANRRAQNKFMLVALGALAALVIVLGVLVYSMYVSKDDSQNKGTANSNVVTVNSPLDNYLALKSEPCVAPCGTTLIKIPHGTRLSLGTCKDTYEIADRKRGRWCYVTYAGYTGWIFDGFVIYQ